MVSKQEWAEAECAAMQMIRNLDANAKHLRKLLGELERLHSQYGGESSSEFRQALYGFADACEGMASSASRYRKLAEKMQRPNAVAPGRLRE